MRHRVAAKHFNRDANARKSLIKGLVIELVEHGQMTTTKTRAQEIKRIADKLIHKAQTDSVATRRTLHQFFGRRDVVNTLVEKIAPLFKDRTSGFTRLSPQGLRRGDNSEVFKLALIAQPEVLNTLKSGKTHAAKAQVAKKPATAKTAPAAKSEVVKAEPKPKKVTSVAKKPAAKKTTKKTE